MVIRREFSAQGTRLAENPFLESLARRTFPPVSHEMPTRKGARDGEEDQGGHSDRYADRPGGGHGLQPPLCPGRQIAYPERQCVTFVGDGGFTMLMGEIATTILTGSPYKIVVVKNNSLGQIKWEQMVFLGNPEYACDLHPDRLRGLRPRLRRPWRHHRRSGPLRRGARRGPLPARSGGDRGGGRSQRAADASQGSPPSRPPTSRRHWPRAHPTPAGSP